MRANPRYFILLCELSSELAGCVHRSIVDSESTIAGEAKPNLSQLYLSWLSLAKLAKLNFFKTPASVASEVILHRKTTCTVGRCLYHSIVHVALHTHCPYVHTHMNVEWAVACVQHV